MHTPSRRKRGPIRQLLELLLIGELVTIVGRVWVPFFYLLGNILDRGHCAIFETSAGGGRNGSGRSGNSRVFAWNTISQRKRWKVQRSNSAVADEISSNSQSPVKSNAPSLAPTHVEPVLEYDMIVIGAGASGMFGAGSAASLGAKTLLLDVAAKPASTTTAATLPASTSTTFEGTGGEQIYVNEQASTVLSDHNIGGDCTNAACVPSKALRSIARMASSSDSSLNWLSIARNHSINTVRKVKAREEPAAMVERNPNLDLALVTDAFFVSPNEMKLSIDRCYIKHLDSQNTSSSSLSSSPTESSKREHPALSIRVRAKKFLIATGAGPKSVPKIESSAQVAGIPVYNYRSMLKPPPPKSTKETAEAASTPTHNLSKTLSSDLWATLNPQNGRPKTIVIAGGGATACELGQTLARLANGRPNRFAIPYDHENINATFHSSPGQQSVTAPNDDSNTNPLNDDQDINLHIHIVAPCLLRGEDESLQRAAYDILSNENGVHFHLGQYVDCVVSSNQHNYTSSRSNSDSDSSNDHNHNNNSDNNSCSSADVVLSDGSTTIDNVDAILLCTGRYPGSALSSLKLENANIEWNETHGVLVHPRTLRSQTAPHVYACGDVASVMSNRPTARTASHAAWTGYHAVSKALLPAFLTWRSKATHGTVPRVIYTDPELVSVGMSKNKCIQKYGVDGFDLLNVSEEGTDRSDMESLERLSTVGFVELRATKVDGRVLGFTGCGPSASELANEMSLVIENKLTVRQVAKSLHSYPSHGYLLHRVALSMALSNVFGLLEACGPVGDVLSRPGRFIAKIIQRLRNRWIRIRNRFS